MSKKFAIVFLSVLIFCQFSCTDNSIRKEIERVAIDQVKIKRFEKALFAIDAGQVKKELEKLQPDFLPFLDADLQEEANITQIHGFITDTVVLNIYTQAINRFPDLRFMEEDLTDAFKHIKYYFPRWQPPTVFSYVSGLSYESPVAYNGSDLIIALDMYLGEDYQGYQQIGIPMYKIQRMQPQNIMADCLREIILEDLLETYPHSNLLDKIVMDGKVLHLIDLFAPKVKDEFKIGFTATQLKWCREHEKEMWAYFLEHQLLYESDPAKVNKFINDGPFTAAFLRESPARAALWVGWQMVRSYSKRNPEISLQNMLLITDPQKFLLQSGYKPGR